MYTKIGELFESDNQAHIQELIEVFHDCFRDVFDLQVIEAELEKQSEASYINFFKFIVTCINRNYLNQKSITKNKDNASSFITNLLNIHSEDSNAPKYFLEKLLFLPLSSKQLGFHEKVATGSLREFEELSFIDMLRLVYYLEQYCSKSAVFCPINTPKVYVSNVRALKFEGDVYSNYHNKEKLLVLNCSLEAEKNKWAVINIGNIKQENDSEIEIFCSLALLDSEKQLLAEKLQIAQNRLEAGLNKHRSKQTRDSNFTGYEVMAWLGKEVFHSRYVSNYIDNSALFSCFIYFMFRGISNSSIYFMQEPIDYNNFFSSEMKIINTRPKYKEQRKELKSTLEKSRKKNTITGSNEGLLGVFVSECYTASLCGKKISLSEMIKTVADKPEILDEKDFTRELLLFRRSDIPGLIKTLKTKQNKSWLSETEFKVTLDISDVLLPKTFEDIHRQVCNISNNSLKTDPKLLNLCSREENQEFDDIDLASAIVLNVFRHYGKMPRIEMRLNDKYQLNDQEQQFIAKLMISSSYVTEFEINENSSLIKLKKTLLPYFARNRWLYQTEYISSIYDNYWEQACKYWLLHLSEGHDLSSDKQESFRRCIREMGALGIQEVFNTLNNPNLGQRHDGLFAKLKPAFYAGCQEDEIITYLNKLSAQTELYFPFSQFYIEYHKGYVEQYISLFHSLNRLEHLHDIIINIKDMDPSFLYRLVHEAEKNVWTAHILIPGYEKDIKKLNSIICRNNHEKAKKYFRNSAAIPLIFPQITKNKTHFSENTEQERWSLGSKGVVSLQVQHQQQRELQQARQRQQQKRTASPRIKTQEPLGELVRYENIERMLGSFYKNLSEEFPIKEQAASLRKASDTVLQGFFRTWIGANPKVVAAGILQAMTLDAAKMLIRNHLRFSAGLQLDNISQGFYTQIIGNELVLLFDPAEECCYEHNPFLIELETAQPQARILTVDLPESLEELVKSEATDTQDWVASHLTEEHLSGLQQLYYQYGDDGLSLFLSLLISIDNTIEAEFYRTLLRYTKNYGYFMQDKVFKALDAMKTRLGNDENRANRQIWLAIFRKHMSATLWEPFDLLWNAFSAFLDEIEELNLVFVGSEFDNIPETNMLPVMDNLIESLKNLADKKTQEQLLRRLSGLDLSRGGVHYAIQREGFQHVDAFLELENFTAAMPGYKPKLDKLYHEDFPLVQIFRCLASDDKFSSEQYLFLTKYFQSAQQEDKDLLVLLLFSQYENYQDLLNLSAPAKKILAQALFKAVVVEKQSDLIISDKTLIAIAKSDLPKSAEDYPVSVLAALQILYIRDSWALAQDLIELYRKNPSTEQDKVLYSLIALYAMIDHDGLNKMSAHITRLIQENNKEFTLLSRQLLSIDFEKSPNVSALKFQNFIETLELMVNQPSSAEKIRTDYIKQLQEQGIIFKYSRAGQFRTLENSDKSKLKGLKAFSDHQERLWCFIQNHIVIPSDQTSVTALEPCLNFFRKIQGSKSSLNEIEPLLTLLLNNSQPEQYWTASSFLNMVDALQPKNRDFIAFPMSVLQVMIKSEALKARPLDEVRELVSDDLNLLCSIMQNKEISAEQGLRLCSIALNNNNSNKQEIVNSIITLLAQDLTDNVRTLILDYVLIKGKKDIDRIFPPQLKIEKDWSQTAEIWLKNLLKSSRTAHILSKIPHENTEKERLFMHILAWSGLDSIKTEQLLSKLENVALEELKDIAALYPGNPAPKTNDLLTILKNLPISEAIENFLISPYSEIRPDYRLLTAQRKKDFQRMLNATRIQQGEQLIALSAEQVGKLSLMFFNLKQWESGEKRYNGKVLSRMNKQELRSAFHNSKNDDSLIWAILFHVIEKTTKKYPHMAQQFAIIANELCINAKMQILQFATGEGKSHIIALRAARHAGMGKTVDVCEAKYSLAERDLKYYGGFFNYLGISVCLINAKSSYESYVQSQIHYTSLPDLSLFLDEQSIKGRPIKIDKTQRVALFDEIDFIRFVEGLRTEFNYALASPRTPKQLMWFYQTVNQFFIESLAKSSEISHSELNCFKELLEEQAGQDSQRLAFLETLDDSKLVGWLQSAADAHRLERNIDFAVQEQAIAVDDTVYNLQEIIPVSTSDNQKAIGSTFSKGVQQLLAVKENTAAKKAQQPQNYFVHPESNIISTQNAPWRMQELWGHWEGFTGTISSIQSQLLHQEQGTQILKVATNQIDRRLWHKPIFFKDKESRMNQTVDQLSFCLGANKSILFACKNDLEVLNLDKVFSEKFAGNIKNQFIFYTNENKKSPAEILVQKQEMEGWNKGQKIEATALIASGFGRGDNVAVQAVFLFDANDPNDLIQKGGRTSRNGAEGEVFQFYLIDDLRKELKELLDLVPEYKELIETQTDEQCLDSVMMLREFVSYKENAISLQYRTALAQFSSWVMNLVSQQEGMKEELLAKIRSSRECFDHAWSDHPNNLALVYHLIQEKADEIKAYFGDSQNINSCAPGMAQNLVVKVHYRLS